MAVPPGLALDLSRLFTSALRPKPRGIDRVEMLYARRLLTSWPGPCVSILSAPGWARAFPRERALIGLDLLEAIWGEAPRAGLLGHLVRITGSLGRSAEKAVPPNAIYLNVGHLALSSRKTLAWLGRRPDVAPVFMLHDLIPVDCPQFVSADEARYFGRILDSLPLARGLIVNTRAVAEHPRLAGLATRTLVAPLPLSPVFLEPAAQSDEAAPYVLAYGEMEARKNFAVLVAAWRRLGPQSPAPRLVIAGAAGDAAADLNRAVDSWDPQHARVVLRHGLSTVRLRDLIAGATAVFAPSFAEGFGLAVAEALTLGTPVVASDIAAHREVGQSRALYLSPDDPVAWAQAAQALSDPGQLETLRAAAGGYEATTSEAYFDTVERFLLGLVRLEPDRGVR